MVSLRILAVIHQPGAQDARSDIRRPIDLNASFRLPGSNGVGCLLSDISAAGFRAKVYGRMARGTQIWLRIPGFAALAARIVWARDGEVGCEFDERLDGALLDLIVSDAPQMQ